MIDVIGNTSSTSFAFSKLCLFVKTEVQPVSQLQRNTDMPQSLNDSAVASRVLPGHWGALIKENSGVKMKFFREMFSY